MLACGTVKQTDRNCVSLLNESAVPCRVVIVRPEVAQP
jgi:hypothetical protein